MRFAFFAYIANSMIARVDAAAYGVYLLLRVQMIANPGKSRNLHLIDTRNQNQSYGSIAKGTSFFTTFLMVHVYIAIHSVE